jgi:hypothetical protein
LEDLGVDGSKITKCILKRIGWCGTGFIWLGVEKVASCCEQGDEQWVSIKCGEFVF